MSQDATRARFAATAERLAALGEARIEGTRERLRRFVPLTGDERALDVGTGTGTLALALAPLVREVVGIDLVPEMLDHARKAGAAYDNVSFVEGSALALPVADGEFDLVRDLPDGPPCAPPGDRHRRDGPGDTHRRAPARHRPDRLRRPARGAAHNRLEHLRDPSHVRVLPDQDFRGLFDANWLVLERFEVERDEFELDRYLELAACEGEQRDAVIAEVERLLAAGRRAGIELRRSKDGYALTLTVAWYLLHRGVPDPTDL